MTEPQRILSIGLAASRLSSGVGLFLRAAATAGVTATLVIDDVPHYAESDVNRIRERISGNTSAEAGDVLKGTC